MAIAKEINGLTVRKEMTDISTEDIVYEFIKRNNLHLTRVSQEQFINLGVPPERYWCSIKLHVEEYLTSIADNEKTWVDGLIKLVEHPTVQDSFNDLERFLYWFLVLSYRTNGATNYIELKRRFRRDYREIVRITTRKRR